MPEKNETTEIKNLERIRMTGGQSLSISEGKFGKFGQISQQQTNKKTQAKAWVNISLSEDDLIILATRLPKLIEKHFNEDGGEVQIQQ